MDEVEENDEYRYLFAIWKPGKFLVNELKFSIMLQATYDLL